MNIRTNFLKRTKCSFFYKISCLLFFVFSCIGIQNLKSQDTTKISFGEKLNSTLLRGSGLDEASWLIYDNEGKILGQGKSDKIYDLSFDLPGVYSIQFKHEHKHEGHSNTCNHYAMPDEVKINVSARKILFDTEKITFSKKIISGAASDGLIMNVPITLIGENNDVLVEMNKTIISYGINTTLIGKLAAEQFRLKPGNHILQYKLEGTATKDTYIGFDLIDLNGNVIPFGLNEPIQ